MTDGIGPTTILDEPSLSGLARYMQSKECKRVFVMTGAGISTAAGIPDFRSPETGLYANLARLKLPYPEAVFDIRFFRGNPLPFYTLAHELAPGRYRPTRTHSFIRLLHEKKLLHTCFTQNIDTLERRAGLPSYRIIEAHGSFASQRCIDCKTPFDDAKMKRMIREKTVPKCERCRGLVKPDIVFFGEALPPEFHKAVFNLVGADLLIIIGTSLTVHPFASLTELVPNTCPRVLINLDAVGDIGHRPNDVVLLGKCDDVIQQLCQLLNWEEDLETLWEATKDSLDPEEDASTLDVEAEVQQLAEEVKKVLQLKKALQDSVDLKKATERLDKQDETTTTADKEVAQDAKGSHPEDQEEAETDKRATEGTGQVEAPDREPEPEKEISQDDSEKSGKL